MTARYIPKLRYKTFQNVKGYFILSFVSQSIYPIYFLRGFIATIANAQEDFVTACKRKQNIGPYQVFTYFFLQKLLLQKESV